ncbi:MAG: SDR family NAD(P)-dependent oxidoreductase [Thermoleophilia bacterium]|nr:SDR family NAD(P)-dependent oxidoreductase [Thermoleophilia bacterium]
MASLNGRVALVTGASRGIGADVARMLAAEGAEVVCCARTAHDGEHPLEGSLEGTVAAIRAAGGTAIAVQANLARDEDCERVVEEARAAYGPVDILINNAAVAFVGPTVDLPVSRWTVSWRVTVHATFLLSKLVLPAMIEQGRGRIVNVTSESAIGPGATPYTGGEIVGDTAYGAQKAAIERFTQGLAEEVYPSGVGVAAIAPSLIVPTPGALANAQITGADDPRAEDPAFMPMAIRLLVSDPLERMAGRVLYSQQLLLEQGLIESGSGLGVDPGRRVTGYVSASR